MPFVEPGSHLLVTYEDTRGNDRGVMSDQDYDET